MNDDFRLFRHKVTGRVDRFPAHFAEWDQFEELDPATNECINCVVELPEVQEDEPLFIPADLTDETPLLTPVEQESE